MAGLERLLAGIMQRWGIAPARVIGHSDMAPERKGDPGQRFDWRRLAVQGLAVWPQAGGADPADFAAAARRLAQFNAVQNTYLNTFQVLGGLGLLLGSAGLGVVVLRNVLERRNE